MIAESVTIRDQSHGTLLSDVPFCNQALSSEEIVIGNNVWIGAKATVLQGVHIGDNAIVAANAVVRSNVEAGTLVGGVPARVIKCLQWQ